MPDKSKVDRKTDGTDYSDWFTGLRKEHFLPDFLTAGHEYVSKDTMRNNKNPKRRQMQLIESAFEAGHSVVVDNTNVTVEERALLISLGRTYGAKIIGYYFESRVSACIERNKQRAGKARVPDVAIYATAKKLIQASNTEGFDKLYSVRIANNSTFAISDWIDDKLTDDQ